jgi:ribulose-bisphosphate carboxylase large chain
MTDKHGVHDSVVAKFYIETKLPLRKVAEGIAELETTGKWLGKEAPTELYLDCKGEVAEVDEIAPGKGTITLVFPMANLNMESAAFASIWLLLIGGGTFALVDYEKSRLLDFTIPDWAYKSFPGPKWGLTRTREFLGTKEGELIVGTIVKPTAGLTAEQVADMCYNAAVGGVRFIKDDEKMMNTPYCPLAKRVKLVMEGIRRAQDQTGQNVIYCPHITADLAYLRQNAETALENGATGLMVNFFSIGFPAMEMLARDLKLDVPIYAHCGGREAMGRAEGQGVAPNVVAKFARLMGGDYFRTGILDSYLVGTKEEFALMNETLREPIPGIRDAVPALSGGLSPKNLGANLAAFGLDIMVLAGTGIFSHPMGSRGGVEAMKQAAEAFRLGVPAAEYARSHAELAAALR